MTKHAKTRTKKAAATAATSLPPVQPMVAGIDVGSSGGKPVKKRRNGLGANRIAGALRMAATSLQRSKSALGAAFRRTARHKGGAVAVFAIARKLSQLIYRMLRYGQDYVDIGEKAYEARFEARRLVSLKEAARGLGFTLVKEPLAQG
jgi:transposase